MSDVRLVCGLPASGKSTVSKSKLNDGDVYLNRDKEGGKVEDLLPKLEQAIKDGKDVVVDNLFTTAADRKPFVDLCKLLNVNFLFADYVATKPEDCQFNACMRMARKYDHVLAPDEIKDLKGKGRL